jgi:hypothetical protein
MPQLTRHFVRAAVLYLAAGALLGGVVLWNKAAPIANSWPWLVAHISLVTWGWLLQLTMGVAYWILPRFGTLRPRSWLAGAAFVCLNVALWLSAASPWLRGPWWSAMAGLLQFIGVLAFVLHAWPRVRRSAYGR